MFVRARTHMPKWNRRRFMPDRYSRDGFYSDDGICRTLHYRASSASHRSIPLFSLPSSEHSFSKHGAFLFSLSFFAERRIEPRRYKGCPRRMESSFYTEVAYRHSSFTLRSHIVLFPQYRESRICRESLFVYEFFIERIIRYGKFSHKEGKNKFFDYS